LLWLAAIMAFWLTPVASSLPHVAIRVHASLADPLMATADAADSPDAHFLPTFRLGSAGQPFGWSTAVGDFNTDGTPDLVIADHTSRRAGVYAYQIQFSVSGLDARNFAFESAQAAVTVRVSDVDHDDDLDVVVNSAASREVVGIWLNDGHGRFASANVGRLASEIRRVRSVETRDLSVDPLTLAYGSRRAADGLPVLVDTTPVISQRPLARAASRLQRLFHSPTVAPRGPPRRLA